MKPEERPVGKCYGTTIVGPRGQVVIPIEARRELDMEAGTKLLTFRHPGGKGLVLVKVEAVEELLNIMTQRIDTISRLLRETEKVSEKNESD